jgi:hypothetical protein
VLLHVVFSTLKDSCVLLVGFVLCVSSCWWFRLCCRVYWVQVPHSMCYAAWRGRPKHVEIFMIINHNRCIKLVHLIIFIYDARSLTYMMHGH